VAITSVAGFTEPFRNTHPFYRYGYVNATRTATGSGLGTQTAIGARVVVVTATASGSGTASSVAQILRARSATGSGTGDATAVALSVRIRTATGSGAGTDTAVWVKSHIFRVPYTYIYSQGTFRGEGTANRLQSYNRHGVRALNLYHLTNDSYTTVEQRDASQIAKLWHGGRDHFLTVAEVTELTAAGFGASFT